MSKELIEKLREKAESLTTTVGVMNLLHEAADALEAKAAPVGERGAFEAYIRVGGHSNPDKHPDGSYVSSVMELWWQGWKARAAHQRQQALEVVMPDVSTMAKVLSDRAADACNIDRTDNWAMYGQEYIDDVQAMLEVARLNPAPATADSDVREVK